MYKWVPETKSRASGLAGGLSRKQWGPKAELASWDRFDGTAATIPTRCKGLGGRFRGFNHGSSPPSLVREWVRRHQPPAGGGRGGICAKGWAIVGLGVKEAAWFADAS